MKKTYKVNGIRCEGCSSKIQKAISSLPGVIGVNVNQDSITIESERELRSAQINATLTSIGRYTVEDVEEVAYSSRSCCTGINTESQGRNTDGTR